MKTKNDQGLTVFICPCCKLVWTGSRIDLYRSHLVAMAEKIEEELSLLPEVGR